MDRRKHCTIVNLRKHSGNQSGFTLAELMVAILIIAILVAIVVPVLMRNRDRADSATAKYNLKIAGAV